MPLPAGPTPTRDQTLTLLRSFMLEFMPTGFDAVIGQANRVAEPSGPDYAVLTFVGLEALATVVDTWSTAASPAPAPTEMNHQRDVGARVQVDIHGPNSADNSIIFVTLFRSTAAEQFFAALRTGIAPLYCDDGQQIPFISGEEQYEDRWVLKPLFELSVNLSTTQDFADTVALTIHSPADALTP